MSDSQQRAANRDVDTGILQGRWCSPSNRGVARPGTVQEQAVAEAHGLEGATVAGAVHVEQFVPLLLEHFGDAWWRRGDISVHWVSTTVESEPVRCYLQPVDGDTARARVWLNAEGESLVLEGSAALGDDPESLLERRLAQVRGAESAEFLKGVRQGDETRSMPLRIDAETLDVRLPFITEPVREYRDPQQDQGDPTLTPAVAQGRVAPPSLLLAAVRGVEAEIAPAVPAPMGAFGGLQLDYVDGPVLCDRDYLVRGRVEAVTASEHTEILWYRAHILDPADGRTVARVLSMNRLMDAEDHEPGG